jgi:hypothetical protein
MAHECQVYWFHIAGPLLWPAQLHTLQRANGIPILEDYYQFRDLETCFTSPVPFLGARKCLVAH